MANIEKKTIEERIDKNKDNIRDYMEIRDFLLEDKNQTENIKDLGEYLNNIGDSGYNEIKQTLQSVMEDPEIIKMFEGIEEKVKKNENLTDDEISVLYINAVLYGKGNGFINVGEFDLSLPIEKICNGYLLAYIQKRYNNYNYNPNKEKGDRKPTVENTKKEEKEYRNPNVPSPFPEKVDKKEQIEREYEGLPQIPPISQRGNEYIHSYCNKIYKRAEDNGYLMMAEYESRLKNEFRSHFSISEFQYVNDKEFDAYVKYDKMLFAFSKYCEVINKKHEQVIEKAGYHDMDEISQEMKYFSLFQDLIKEKYPELEAIMKRLEPYWGEMEENKNKYFGGKTDEEIEKAGQNFKEFQEFQNKKSEEYGITDEMIKSLNTTPNTKEETEEYFKNLNKVLIYQNVLNGKKGEYGDTIDNYYGYMIGISEIQKRYSEADFDTIKNYSKDLETRGQNINFERCRKYASLIDRTGKYGALGKDLENIGIIQEVLMDPTNDNFFILDVKNAEIAKKLRQERIDKTRDIIKTYAPQVYWSSTILAGFWNGLVDSTIGVGTSLGAMITGLIGGKEHYQSQLQKKERRDNFLKFNQSSSQKEAVYDGKSLNFKRDNTISTVSGSIAQMLCLIYGGSAVGKGIGKLGTKAGLTISENVVSRAGLFGMSFITQVGQSYGEAINSGLDGTGAFAYSMLSASIQSGLELISPNDILLGKGTGLGKQLISSICKNEGGIKLVGKYFLKSVGREIFEENLQEGLQLAAGNLVMEMVNRVGDGNFEVDWNPKNFLSTAIITTLTTGITTGFTAGRQGIKIFNSSQQELIGRIFSTPGLYEDVINVLNKSIEGNLNIPNVQAEEIKGLRMMLTYIHETQNVNENQTENQSNETESQLNNENNVESRQQETVDETLEIEKIGKIFREFNFDFDEEYASENLKFLYGKSEQYIRDMLGLLNNHITYGNDAEYYIFRDLESLNFILNNSIFRIENIEHILEDERINIHDIEYAIKENNNIQDENMLIQEIKKFNILLNIESENDLENFLKMEKFGNNITGNIDQYIIDNGLTEYADQIKNWYYGNFNTETQNFTMARDLEGTEYDIQLIKNIINNQNIQPRLFENNTIYEGLIKLHNDNSKSSHELFCIYSKYLLGEDVTGIAGNISEISGGGNDNDIALYRHTRTGDGYQRGGATSRYRIIGEFSRGEIIRSGDLDGVANRNSNWSESEWVTLGEVQNNNVSQIIDLETGKVIYDRDSGYVDPAFRDQYMGNQTNEENNQEDQKQETQQVTEQQEVPNEGKTNVERLQELGIEIPEVRREYFNKMKLDFKKLRQLKELGINIDTNNVILFNQKEFDFEKLGKLKEFGIDINSKNIWYLEILNFENTETLMKFQKLQKLGIEIYNNKILEFINPNFEKLGKLKEFGVNIDANNVIGFNQKEFDFEKLGKLKELGVNIDANNVISFNQTEFDFEKLGKLKELGVNIEANNIISFNQTEFDFEKLGKLKESGVNIEANNVISFNQAEFDFEKLGKLKESGVNIDANNVISFNQTEFDFEKLGKLKESGVNIEANNVISFNQTEFDFEKLGKLKEFGININEYNIIELNKIDENKLQKVKEIFDEFGIVVGNDFIDRRGAVKRRYENIKYLREIKHEINQKGIVVKSVGDIELLLNIVSNRFTNKREYMKRRNKFLQENETLSEQKFNELFKDGEDKGKYGIGNIHQKRLGYCYAYTGFELLKKSNFFETLVRTSMRETDNGREVKLPLGDSNGHIIKIKKSEIDSEYSFMDEEEGHQKNVNINSDSSLGFKILEIAFIKEYLINPPSSKVQGIVNKVKNEYETTGDITINGKLLHQLEGGRTTEFMERILGSKIYTHKTDFKSIVPILDYINYGDIKIDLDLSSNISGKKNVMCKLKDGKTGQIITDHAYSIERTYIDRETKEKIIVIVNPRDTSKKLEMTLNECSTVFSHAGVTTININKIFTEGQENVQPTPFKNGGENGVNQSIDQSNESENHTYRGQETQLDVVQTNEDGVASETNNILNELGIENLNLESILQCLETANKGQLLDLFKLKEVKQIIINELSKSDFLNLLNNDFNGDLILTLLDREGCEILSKCRNISERINYLLTRSKAKDILLETDYFCNIILNNSNFISNLNQYICDNQYFFDYVINNIGNNYKIILEFNEKEQIQLLKELDIPIDFIKNNLSEFKKESIEWLLNNKIKSIEDDISREDFKYLVDNHIEFPKSIITPKLINRLLETRDVLQSRILIEKFSIDNDASLFNKILREREQNIIENINHKNGLLLKYNQLLAEFEKLEYNENNIYEFWESFEKCNIEIDTKFQESFIEAFPNKSKIQNLIIEQSNIELSDIIIDYHFNDISYNVFLDIKQLLNFQISNGVTIPIEHLKIYRDVINIDNLTVEEKINLHNSLKGKNIVEMFYNDYSNSRNIMYQEISDSILNNNTIKKFEDKGLTEQYGVNVYKFDGQDFFGLVRRSPYTNGKSNTVGCSFSLIGKDCIGTYGGKPQSETFVYEGLEPQAIIHAYPSDSYTQLSYSIGSDAVSSHYVRTLMTPTELLNATHNYNEILVLKKGSNDSEGYGNIGEIRPIALYCYDEITPEDIEVAKREGVGIMLIITESYKNVESQGHFYERDENSKYIKSESEIENAKENRAERTGFERDEELKNIINGKE